MHRRRDPQRTEGTREKTSPPSSSSVSYRCRVGTVGWSVVSTGATGASYGGSKTCGRRTIRKRLRQGSETLRQGVRPHDKGVDLTTRNETLRQESGPYDKELDLTIRDRDLTTETGKGRGSLCTRRESRVGRSEGGLCKRLPSLLHSPRTNM